MDSSLEYKYLSEIAYSEALLNDCLEEEVLDKLLFSGKIESLKEELDLYV